MFYWTDFYINKICLWRHDQPVKVIEKDTAEKFIWLYHIRSDHKLHGQLLPVRDGRDGSCKRIWFWFLNLSFLYFINKLPNITFGGQRLNMSMFFLLLCLFQNPNVSKVKYSERIESFFFFSLLHILQFFFLQDQVRTRNRDDLSYESLDMIQCVKAAIDNHQISLRFHSSWPLHTVKKNQNRHPIFMDVIFH